MNELNRKKLDPVQSDLAVADDDLIAVNSGGKIIAAKCSTMSQLKGPQFKALSSGCWDKKLQQDSNRCIFVDINPVMCFQTIDDHLNKMTTLSDDFPPSPPNVDDEHGHILQHQLELFGLLDKQLMEELPNLTPMTLISNSKYWSKYMYRCNRGKNDICNS